MDIIPKQATPKTQHKIILIMGRKGSGKDTTADIIRDFYKETPNPASNLSGLYDVELARPIKKYVSELFGWKLELISGRTEESRKWREIPEPEWSSKIGKPVIPRDMLVKVGTSMKKDVSINIWVIKALEFLESIIKPGLVIIRDVRYIHEIDYISSIYEDVTILTVKRNGVTFGYEDKLTKAIQFGLLDQSSKNSLDNIEKYLEAEGVFIYPNLSEKSEWQTCLIQKTGSLYLENNPKTGTKPKIYEVKNSDSLDHLNSLVISILVEQMNWKPI